MAGITVGFIGTGAMGEHMCRNVAKKGAYSVIAFDLSSDPLQRLANNGVAIAETAMDAAVKSNVLILSLPGGPEVESLAPVSYTHLTLPTICSV